jgi:hypothetical protein
MKILEFLQVPANIERLKVGLEHTYTPSQEELQQIDLEITRLQAEEEPVQGYSSDAYHDVMYEHWPSLSRVTGAEILVIVSEATAEKPVPVQLALEFANDGLYCEWAYVVDLDQGVFEVFTGSEMKDRATCNRFSDIGGENVTVPVLLKRFSVAELPTTEKQFIIPLVESVSRINEERLAAAHVTDVNAEVFAEEEQIVEEEQPPATTFYLWERLAATHVTDENA